MDVLDFEAIRAWNRISMNNAGLKCKGFNKRTLKLHQALTL